MLNLTEEQKKQIKELKKNKLFKPYIVLKLLQNNILEMKEKGVKLKDILLILEKEIEFKMHYVSFTQAVKKLLDEKKEKEETITPEEIQKVRVDKNEVQNANDQEEYVPIFHNPEK